jgi:hypothetical protein
MNTDTQQPNAEEPATPAAPKGYIRKQQARKQQARIQLNHPKTGESIPVFVTLWGPGSPVHDDASDRMRKRTRDLIRKFKRHEDIPHAETRANYREFLVDVTANIEGLALEDGTPEAFTRQVADEFYDDIEIAAQVSGELSDRRNF